MRSRINRIFSAVFLCVTVAGILGNWAIGGAVNRAGDVAATKLLETRYTMQSAMDQAAEAFATESPGTLKTVHSIIYACRISEMLNAGYTNEQIAVWKHSGDRVESSARCSEQWAARFVRDLPRLELVFAGKQVPTNTRDLIRFCHFGEMRAAGYEYSEAMLRSLTASPTDKCSERVAADMLRYINGMGPLPPEWPIPHQN